LRVDDRPVGGAELRALALHAPVDRSAGVLAGELEELPLAAEQPDG
jgi:hypothetical protein